MSRRVSADQLAALARRLSDRDGRILDIAAELRLMQARHVEGLIFTEGSPLTRARRARAALARLTDLGLLARLDRRIGGVRAGSSGYVYRLGHLGRRLLGLRSTGGWKEPGQQYVEHTLAGADLHLALAHAVNDGRIEGFDIEHEPTAWRRFTGLGGDQQWLKPDLFVRLLTAELELLWFVEIDRGTEGLTSVKNKTEQYLAYWRTGIEQQRLGAFPRLLWLVPEEHRASGVRFVLEHLGPQAQALAVVTTEETALAVLSGQETEAGS